MTTKGKLTVSGSALCFFEISHLRDPEAFLNSCAAVSRLRCWEREMHFFISPFSFKIRKGSN